jgi:hypothetical protein
MSRRAPAQSPQTDTAQIEQYLGVDGFQERRQGLTALIDGDVCGFVLPAGHASRHPARSRSRGCAARPLRRAAAALLRREELTGGPIGEQPTAIELWWTLQARQLTGR